MSSSAAFLSAPHPPAGTPDDPPPAYSPGPDPFLESTVERGPRRPFIPAPAPAQHLAARVDDNGGVAYVDPRANLGYGAHSPFHVPGERSIPPGPPPRHPSSPGGLSSPGLSRQRSVFAAEFYSAGTGEPSPGSTMDDLYGPTPPMTGSSSLGPSSSRRYAPPQNAPPSSAASGSAANGIPDDGRPTRIPVPGHPLLNDGRILVYPAGHECPKCQNTGYKHDDPSHPCKRCWSRFAKPYAGPITYAPSAGAGAGSSSAGPTAPFTAGGKSFQRPLRHFVAPPARLSVDGLFGRGGGADRKWDAGQSLGRSQSLANMRTGAFAPPAHPPPPPPGPPMMMQGGHAGHAPFGGGFGGPPPGALVVRPGDARLGGAPCWRCGGTGVIRFVVFEERCGSCGGVGRVW